MTKRRIPINSEADAFRVVCVTVAVLTAAAIVGSLTEPVVGAVLLGGVVLGALGWELLSRDPDAPQPLRESAAQGRVASPAGGRHRVLVIANETVGGRELRAALLERDGRPEVRVVCPILPSRAHLIASDIDRELAEARERLDDTLAWAKEQGIDVTGHVSEETPLVAIADELRGFPADELIVSTHPPARSRWLESGLVERVREELDMPVRHVVVEHAPVAARR